jgi:hypothetical protein
MIFIFAEYSRNFTIEFSGLSGIARMDLIVEMDSLPAKLKLLGFPAKFVRFVEMDFLPPIDC